MRLPIRGYDVARRQAVHHCPCGSGPRLFGGSSANQHRFELVWRVKAASTQAL